MQLFVKVRFILTYIKRMGGSQKDGGSQNLYYDCIIETCKSSS